MLPAAAAYCIADPLMPTLTAISTFQMMTMNNFEMNLFQVFAASVKSFLFCRKRNLFFAMIIEIIVVKQCSNNDET